MKQAQCSGNVKEYNGYRDDIKWEEEIETRLADHQKSERLNQNLSCHNCNEQGHFIWQFPKPNNMSKNVNLIIKETPKQSRKILFELCQKFDANTTNDSVYLTLSKSSDNDKQVEEAEQANPAQYEYFLIRIALTCEKNFSNLSESKRGVKKYHQI